MVEPVPLPMSDARAVKLLREICADSGNVKFTDHARKRMAQRKVTPVQVIDCLVKGIIAEPGAPDMHGNWKLTMTRRAGGREVQVAAAIDLPRRVVVITVY